MVVDLTIGEVMANSGRKAAECLRVYWPERTFPVDPVRIAERLGVKVLEATLPPTISGAVSKRVGQDPIILVEKDDSDARKRFTIAHELGHYLLRSASETVDYVDLRGPSSSKGIDREEVYANNFAANLLMPADEVKRAWKEHEDEIALSGRFFVSLDALSTRLRTLKLRV